MIQVKRVYDPPMPSDGTRVLVDRLWPRGVTKARARVDVWQRDLAPSQELRFWYGHEPSRFLGFRKRYRLELFQQREALSMLAIEAELGTVTLLCAATDPNRSNAAVLKDLLEEVLEGGRAPFAPRRPRTLTTWRESRDRRRVR